MLTNQEKARYQRQIMLPEVGEEGQLKLRNAGVLMIGCGGLGCPVLQYLTALGVGRIGIADSDTVSESNLQRQILYSMDDIGKPKVDIAKEKLLKQNPLVTVHAFPARVDAGNALKIIRDYDIIVDGSDNFATRYLLNDACVILDKPLVFGSIYMYEGQISVFNYKDGPTYRCLYPEPPIPADMPSAAVIGVLGILPGVIGVLQATEVVKIITGIGEVLSGKLLTYNALEMCFSTFCFKALPKNKQIKSLLEKY
jgi:sulfur-carrier protein adenylyltransferase/sulfurtransferase